MTRPAHERSSGSARRHVDAAPAAELAAYDEHLHVMLLLIEAYWAALIGDLEANRSAAAAAVALADADGRPFPRAIARTLAISGLPYLDDPMAENAVERIGAAASSQTGSGSAGWPGLGSLPRLGRRAQRRRRRRSSTDRSSSS